MSTGQTVSQADKVVSEGEALKTNLSAAVSYFRLVHGVQIE